MVMSDEVLEAHGNKRLEEFTHWAYVLRCSNSYRTFDELQRKAGKRLDYEPEWLREAFEAKRLYYIGQTENIEKRLGQHFNDYFSSDFTTLFKPHCIVSLHPEHSRNSAQYKEHSIYESYKEGNDCFAYSK